MRILLVIASLAALLFGAASFALAQSDTAQDSTQQSATPTVISSPILVIDSDRLFAESNFGKRVVAERDVQTAVLFDENRRIEAELEEEERALTEQRKTMAAEDFRAAADAFDDKVQAIRDAQISKEIAITRWVEGERIRFLSSLNPVLEQILLETNALIILEKRTTFVARDVLDVTDRMVFQANQIIGDGTVIEQQ